MIETIETSGNGVGSRVGFDCNICRPKLEDREDLLSKIEVLSLTTFHKVNYFVTCCKQPDYEKWTLSLVVGKLVATR